MKSNGKKIIVESYRVRASGEIRIYIGGDEIAVFNEVWALNMGKRFRPYVAIC